MYPPLSTVFNPDDEIPGLDIPAGAGDKEKTKTLQNIDIPIPSTSGMVYRVVDIDIDDVVKSTEASPAASSVSTVTKATVTATETTTAGQNARGSLVASRMARMSRLLSTEGKTPVVSSEWRESSPEKEELVAPNENHKQHESPGTQRRTLPRVPSDAEPFVSTPKTTKITSRKQTGKPKKGKKNISRDVEYGESVDAVKDEEAKKYAEDLDFVVVDVNDVQSSKKEVQETPEKVDWTSGSSEDDLLEGEKQGKLHRHNARRFFKGKKRHRETLDEKEKRHEQDKIRYEMKQREQKRLRMAQSIQRELEEVEVKQAALEQEGIKTEKALRGGTLDATKEKEMMLEFFQLVNKKNALIRYESELVILANSIQLEDQQGRLEQEIRELLMKDAVSKHDQKKIQEKTKELVDLVEQRNALVELLDEERKREQEEDKLFESMIAAKGFVTSV